jgi:hypothetical protein
MFPIDTIGQLHGAVGSQTHMAIPIVSTASVSENGKVKRQERREKREERRRHHTMPVLRDKREEIRDKR